MDGEIVEKYLRPKAIAESRSSSAWAESTGVWIADPIHGFVAGRIVEEDDSNVLVELEDRRRVTVASTEILSADSARNDRCEDMAEMTELNEATVLNNLRRRYRSSLIYSYSGLFLVAINPYRTLPIYSAEMAQSYAVGESGGNRQDRPPHIFAVAEQAYRSLRQSRANQSILITGESGAGKTENTKRVIQYLVGAASQNKQLRELEQRIMHANPILESFGNAQTLRNNNSSRFGKFVKIEFSSDGQIVGASIERYLLEKSRVTHRNSGERSFHIFYQLLCGADDGLRQELGLKAPEHFALLKQSNLAIEAVDDEKAFAELKESMAILGFSEAEQKEIWRLLSIILHLGNLDLVEDEQGQAKVLNMEQVSLCCQLMQVDHQAFLSALLNPVLKAGQEIISQARDLAQVTYSLEALCRSLYERLFTHLLQRLNQAIDGKSGSNAKRQFIGVLDIAGFEIFPTNGFEQLCINYTNERLQQFFNHHMFIREQEEYQREGIEWNFVDFGLDLQPTIDLIEKSLVTLDLYIL